MSLRRITYVIGEYFGTFLPPVLAYLLLALWAALIWQVARAAPDGAFPPAVTVRAADAPVTLGWSELGQHRGPRSAANRHLRLTRGGDGWRIGNRAYNRRIDAQTALYDSVFVQRWRLARGDKISFDGPTLLVTDIGPDHITIRHVEKNREVTWRASTLSPKGEPVTKVCKGWVQRRAYHARWSLYDTIGGDSELALFTIGGGVNCTDRWKLEAMPPGAVGVGWQRGGFWLLPGGRRHDTLISRQGGKAFAFAEMALPLNGRDGRVENIILGRTKYRLRESGADLTLRPSLNIDYWTDEDKPPSNFTRVNWIGDGRGVLEWALAVGWRLPAGLVLVLVAAGVLWWFWQRQRERELSSYVYTLAALGPALYGVWVTNLLRTGAGGPDDLLLIAMVWIAWFWATVMLVWSRRLFGLSGLLWVAALFLALAGTTTLLQLAAGADNSWWLGFVRKHAVLLAAYGWGICVLCAIPITVFERIWMWLFTREAVIAGAAIVMVGLMILQLIGGGEEGIGGIQPVELMKSVLVVLLGFAGLHITETRRRGTRAYRHSPLLFILPYLRFVGLLLIVVLIIVVGVRDFSPIVILGVLMMAWFWRLGKIEKTERGSAFFWRWFRPLVLLFVIGFGAAGYWVYKHPDELPTSFPQRDRILVWAEPAKHQHSGSQVLGGLENISTGGWRGAGANWFGKNGSVLTVPAVQDDFITAFYLHKFGGIAGLVLMGFQLLYLIILYRLSRQVAERTGEGDFDEQNAGTVMSYTVYGLAAMQATHWTIAWGNSLGLLPVMGQPMTWISAGNSHLMGFALLTVSIGLITAWFSRARM